MPNILTYIYRYKFFIILVSALAPFSGAHTFRQNDTMGVTIRYWLRWFHEETLHHPFLPAILNAGDAYGITTMEFPFVNLLTVPGMILGTDYGRFAAKFIYFASNLLLCYFHHKVWADKKINGVLVGPTTWLLLIFSTFHIYIDKYIPDPMAFLFMSLAVGVSWEKINVKKSLPLAVLGILIKPPVVFAFGLFFLRDFKTQRNNFLFWALPAVVLAGLYYSFGVNYLSSLSDINQFFAIKPRNPITSLYQFFSDPVEIFKLIFKTYFTKFLLILLMIDIFLRRKTYLHFNLWLILLVQTLAAAALIGTPGFFHEYYYISTSFICCFLLKDFLEQSSKKLVHLAVLVLSIHTLERSFYSLKPVFKDHLWYECREINQYIPKEVYKLNSKAIRANAAVGTCFGKVQGAKSSDFFVLEKYRPMEPPENFKLIHETQNYSLYQRD